ncbi:MFS transporter [Phycicoccus duodecadis]|uniref:Na+/melibiose symporter-like transporter n=1 Tax=Phycicoccus duodecadis TaxID=173053 RepID=A0A2N3YIV6_9MICO|nr:MFS transporter [Phycicoccus duodecadis]PKW26773.1 Na+/melibiose symporter-like transporter [Phycicoccus duodecadis]
MTSDAAGRPTGRRAPTAPGPARALPASARRGYGLGSVATGSFGTVPGLLLLPYLTDRLGVAAGVAGLVVFLPKAWDVLLNPVAGRISDRSTHPGGRRRPFLLRAGLLLAVLFVLLFSGPTAPTGIATAWVVVAFLGCATAYAFFQVPYVAMPAEMTDDYDERTRLMTWRVAVLALAILVSGGLAPVVRDALGPTWGYRGVGLFVGALIAVGTLGAWWGTRTAPTSRAATAGGSLGDQLRVVASSREFRTLLGVFVLQALATGSMLAGVDYVARVLLGSPAASTVLFVCFVGPALLVTPLWQRVGRARGKRSGYLWGSLLLGLGALATLAAVPLGLAATAVTVAVVGVGYAACQMFPLAMLPDVAAADTARTGEDRAGTYTGVWTAGETLGLALGPFLYAGALTLGGYVSSTDAAAAQPASARTAIALGFTVVPAVLVALSLVLLRHYRPDREVAR